MRADIHDGPEHMLQSEAGYIDARPLTPARQNLLQRTAGPYMWVKLRNTQPEEISSALPPKNGHWTPYFGEPSIELRRSIVMEYSRIPRGGHDVCKNVAMYY
jgi:hypothetical protein